MPELPEVETVRRTLKEHLVGLRIIDIEILYPQILKNETVQSFKTKIIGQTIRDMKRYAKYLIFVLDDYSLISHLRMEGKYFIKPAEAELTKHEHLVFKLDNGKKLTYHDVRKFGTIDVVKKGLEFKLKSLSVIGPEANNADIDIKSLYDKIHKSNRPIKAILLDQTVISGLGNIYVDESLFLARIHPETKGTSLTRKDVEKILAATKAVLNKAVELGGTTIRTYQSSLGVDGRFQNELNVHTLVGQECHVCGTKIEKIRVGGRGTYFCPTCQKRK